MGADYLFYVKAIETHARAFFKVIIFPIGSVLRYILFFLYLSALTGSNEYFSFNNQTIT
jgi:hypothetical protein